MINYFLELFNVALVEENTFVWTRSSSHTHNQECLTEKNGRYCQFFFLLEVLAFPSSSPGRSFSSPDHQAELLAGRVVVRSPWDSSLMTQSWHSDGCMMNRAGPARGFTTPSCGRANRQPKPVPIRVLWMWIMSLSACIVTALVLGKVWQLQNWAPGRNVTSFADLPLSGQTVQFQSKFIHSPPGKMDRGWLRKLMMMMMAMVVD